MENISFSENLSKNYFLRISRVEQVTSSKLACDTSFTTTSAITMTFVWPRIRQIDPKLVHELSVRSQQLDKGSNTQRHYARAWRPVCLQYASANFFYKDSSTVALYVVHLFRSVYVLFIRFRAAVIVLLCVYKRQLFTLSVYVPVATLDLRLRMYSVHESLKSRFLLWGKQLLWRRLKSKAENKEVSKNRTPQ